MVCISPLHGWWSRTGGFTVKSKDAYLDMRMKVPCGQCIACRLSSVAAWATRLMQEAMLHDQNAFVTLTYNVDNLPVTEKGEPTLDKRHIQRFFKRLRKFLSPEKIRYYAAGEYGEDGRPHYHAIIFGYWPEDCITYKEKKGYRLYISTKLTSIWKKGYCTVGEVNFETAAYTAKYIVKKALKSERSNDGDGKLKEFQLQSNRPGIGRYWYEKYKDETWNSDSVISKGREVSVPRYYKKILQEQDPEKAERLRLKRVKTYYPEERLEEIRKFLENKEKFFMQVKEL